MADTSESADRKGQAEPIRALDILDDEELWRRIPPFRNTYDANQQRVRPGKDCFADHTNGTPMSVYRACLTGDPGNLLRDVPPGFGVVALNARQIRDLGLTLLPKPKPNEPGHAEVIGKKTDSIKSKLAKASEWKVKTDPFDPTPNPAKPK